MIFNLINIYCKRKFGSKAFGNLSNYFKGLRFADAQNTFVYKQMQILYY